MPEGFQPGGESPEKISYVKEAFNSQYNWIALTGAALFALISGSALPLLLGAGLELMYLSVIPHNPRFQRLVRARKGSEQRRQTQARLGAMALSLPPEFRKRYDSLQTVCEGIRANYSQLSSTSQIFARQTEESLQGLLQGFLRLLHSARLHRDYLGTIDSPAIKAEMEMLERSLASDSPKVKEINSRRVEILRKRLDKVAKIRENRLVIDAQCAAIEDVLQLIRDQSVTMRDLRQVSDQLGNLVRDVEQTEETVRQVEAIFDAAEPDVGGPLPSVPSPPQGTGPKPEPRNPVRN